METEKSGDRAPTGNSSLPTDSSEAAFTTFIRLTVDCQSNGYRLRSRWTAEIWSVITATRELSIPLNFLMMDPCSLLVVVTDVCCCGRPAKPWMKNGPRNLLQWFRNHAQNGYLVLSHKPEQRAPLQWRLGQSSFYSRCQHLIQHFLQFALLIFLEQFKNV